MAKQIIYGEEANAEITAFRTSSCTAQISTGSFNERKQAQRLNRTFCFREDSHIP